MKHSCAAVHISEAWAYTLSFKVHSCNPLVSIAYSISLLVVANRPALKAVVFLAEGPCRNPRLARIAYGGVLENYAYLSKSA